MLHLRTLGTLELTAPDGRPLDAGLTQPKRSALLAYLVISSPRGWRTRDELVALFWPEMSDIRARAALRRALHFLRASIGADVLRGRGDAVSIDESALSCDVICFERALAEGRPREAMALYGGELLAGMYVREAPAFERWLDGERSRLQRLAGEACWTLAELGRDEADPAAAAHWVARAVSLDPLDEAGQRRGISILASIGAAVAALRAYELFADQLARELDVSPSPDTVALITAVRAGCRTSAHVGEPELERDRPPPPLGEALTEYLEPSGEQAEVRPDLPALTQPPALASQPLTGSSAEPASDPAPVPEHSPSPGVPSKLEAVPEESPTSTTAAVPKATPARAARRPVWRSVRTSVAIPLACLLIAALYALGTTVLDRGRKSMVVDSNSYPRVLILPFTVVGRGDAPLLAHGMVELLSTALDGAGALRVVDQQALLPLERDDGSDTTIREFARRLGVQFVVQGSVVTMGDRLEARAVLMDSSGATIASAGASGDDSDLLAVSDDLARQLLGALNAGPDARLTRLAIHTSDSLTAVKAYLHGVRLLRGGAFGEAADSFRVAVRVDEGFALAYYNLSMAIGWASGGRDREATLMAERAVQHSDALGAHDRALLLAHAQAWGEDPLSAEQLYREILSSYPDDMEAWYELGDVIFHNGPASGRSALSARYAFQRARQMPGLRSGVRVHLARLAALAGDGATLRALASEVREELEDAADPDSPPYGAADRDVVASGSSTTSRTTRSAAQSSTNRSRAGGDFAFSGATSPVMDARDDEVLLLDAVHHRDDLALQGWLAASRTRDDATLWTRIWSVARFTGDLSAAEQLARPLLTAGRPTDVQDLGWLAIAHFRLAGGQPLAAISAVEQLSEERAHVSLAFRGQVAALSFVPSTMGARAALRDSLTVTARTSRAAWKFSAEGTDRGSSAMLGSAAGAGLLASPVQVLAQLYQRDSLDGGRQSATVRPEGGPGLPGSVGAGMRALSPASRLRHADSLLNAGNARDALSWYGSLPEADGYDVIYLALAARGQVRAAAAIGDTTNAQLARLRLARLWQNAEPEVKAMMSAQD